MPEKRSTTIHIVLLFFLAFVLITSKANAQAGLLPDTTRSCFTDSLLLDAGAGFTTYQWSTGENTQAIWVYGEGSYIVTASGDTTITDSTYVRIFDGYLVQKDSAINCGDTIVLSGNSDEYKYLWFPGGSTDTSITVFPRDTTTYFVTISDSTSLFKYCIDSIKVSVKSLMTIDTIMQLNMGCPGDNKARIKIDVSGGYPGYHYKWPYEALFENDSSLAFGLTDGEKSITITDSLGCSISRDFIVKA